MQVRLDRVQDLFQAEHMPHHNKHIPKSMSRFETIPIRPFISLKANQHQCRTSPEPALQPAFADGLGFLIAITHTHQPDLKLFQQRKPWMQLSANKTREVEQPEGSGPNMYMSWIICPLFEEVSLGNLGAKKQTLYVLYIQERGRIVV